MLIRTKLAIYNIHPTEVTEVSIDYKTLTLYLTVEKPTSNGFGFLAQPSVQRIRHKLIKVATSAVAENLIDIFYTAIANYTTMRDTTNLDLRGWEVADVDTNRD